MIRRGEPVYEPRRRALVAAGRVPRGYPELIARPRSQDEVAKAVMAARAEGLRVAVRAGGHSWCGASLRDGTLLLDLSALAAVSVEARARTAGLGPGLTTSGLTAALEPHGLGFPAGHSRGVGMGGYLLNGGLGWNAGAWGPACHSVIAVEAQFGPATSNVVLVRPLPTSLREGEARLGNGMEATGSRGGLRGAQQGGRQGPRRHGADDLRRREVRNRR